MTALLIYYFIFVFFALNLTLFVFKFVSILLNFVRSLILK